MIFGMDLVENTRRLADIVPHIEILLYHTPEQHNIPTARELKEVRAIRDGEGLSLSVHLPASLEIAANEPGRRRQSLDLARKCCAATAELDPLHYVIHVPYSPPTLVAVPGLYFTFEQAERRQEWWIRAEESLAELRENWTYPGSLLVENINFTPSLLEPLWTKGLCKFCLDIGHLVLGGEKVTQALAHYLPITREIHLHGVRGHEEHISIGAFSDERLRPWAAMLMKDFRGILNLEVFSQADLEESLAILERIT